MQINKPTQGEINLYQKIKGFEVRGSLGNSSAGYGWRPVCGGYYLGNDCLNSEKAAITKGKIFVDDLKRRVESIGAPISHKSVAPKRVSKKRSAKNGGL